MDEIRQVAQGIRRTVARHHERHGRGNYEGEVKSVAPLRVDAGAIDQPLNEDDITIADALATHLGSQPLAVGDTLVLVEPEPGDYTAVDVLRGGAAPGAMAAEPRDLLRTVVAAKLAPPAELPVFLREAPADYADPCILAVPDDSGRCAMIYRP